MYLEFFKFLLFWFDFFFNGISWYKKNSMIKFWCFTQSET